jgi:hypothetical protein
MIPLAESFRLDGFDFRLVKREGDVALFAKTKPRYRDPSYEVVLVQKRKAHTWPDGRTTPDHEAMPGSEAWGESGWTYSDLPAAQVRFSSLARLRNSGTPLPPDAPEAPGGCPHTLASYG